jgi:hypothetical protein
MTRRIIPLLCMLGLLLSACGEGQSVGNQGLLDDIKDQGGDFRFTPPPLPDEEEGGGQLAIDQRATPPPAEAPAPTPPPAQVTYFDVELVADSPFYKPGNALEMSSGAVLRVTNRDATPERACRSFTDKQGTFNSGCLKPGESWTFRLGQGRFDIIDQGLPFATATLTVR